MKRKYISVHCYMMAIGKLRIHRDEVAGLIGEDNQVIADFDDEISVFDSALKDGVIEVDNERFLTTTQRAKNLLNSIAGSDEYALIDDLTDFISKGEVR